MTLFIFQDFDSSGLVKSPKNILQIKPNIVIHKKRNKTKFSLIFSFSPKKLFEKRVKFVYSYAGTSQQSRVFIKIKQYLLWTLLSPNAFLYLWWIVLKSNNKRQHHHLQCHPLAIESGSSLEKNDNHNIMYAAFFFLVFCICL